MRTAIRLAFVSLLFWPAMASARPSPRDKVEVRSVRVGFAPGSSDTGEENASGNRDSLYKAGAWTPVYVTIINTGKYDPDPKKDGPAMVVIEAPDCDDTTNEFAVPLPAFDEQEGLAGQASVIAYTRSGSRYSEFTIRVVTASGKNLCEPFPFGKQAAGYPTANGLDSNQGLYLALGTRLPGLSGLGKVDKDPSLPPNAINSARKAYLALVPGINDLPTVWFGYDCADVVILATSDRAFANGLLNDRVRTGALAEWVRRGGRLIICAAPTPTCSPGRPS